MLSPDRKAAQSMWADYRATLVDLSDEEPGVECFGDSAELADSLVSLVVAGTKRATAGLVADYEAEHEPLPVVGGHWVVCDAPGQPQVVVRTSDVRLGPLSSVDAAFAWDEGEGDRSLSSWLDGHRWFFRRRCDVLGLPFSDDVEVCFQRFIAVWPPQCAD